jgi:tellurite resistance protein TerC
MVAWYVWFGFVASLIALLLVDLRLHGHDREMPLREALLWSGIWIFLALAFGVALAAWKGLEFAGEYAAGYLIEWSLSVDNVFVFVLVFAHFAVAPAHQHRVLFWGVMGAIVMRLTFILGGSALIHRFDWIVYVFGGLLLLTAVRFLMGHDREKSLEENLILRGARRIIPITDQYHGDALLVREGGRLLATPLAAVLILIEASDLVFAIDSIPAAFSATRDAFIAFTSNAMAILGLRSLYFVLAGSVERFKYLKPALAAILGFVGVKMIASDHVHLPIWLSLGVIVGILAVALAATWLSARGEGRVADPPQPAPGADEAGARPAKV